MPGQNSIPYSGVSSVAANVGQPNDYQTQQASPADFGAQIGGAVERAGAQSESIGNSVNDYAIKSLDLANQAAVNAANDQWLQKTNNLLSNPQTGFYAKQGYEAVAAHDPTLNQMEIDRAAIGAQLSPRQQMMYNDLTRRQYSWNLESMSRHAAQQNAQAQDQTALSLASTQANTAAISGMNGEIGDGSTFSKQMGDMAATTFSHFQPAYGDDVAIDHTQQMTGKTVYNLGKQFIDAGKPELAAKLLATYETQRSNDDGSVASYGMDKASVLALKNSLRVATVAKAGMDNAQQYFQGPQLTPVGQGGVKAVDVGYTPQQITSAISGQESGNNPNAPTSVNGAVGQMQITPGTFAQYAKPGEKIDNSADNAAVGQRIVADLHQKYNGDPARIAVGYFSGPGNVAPAGSPTPWVKDTTDGNGKSVSSYVSDVQARLSPKGVTSQARAGQLGDENAMIADAMVRYKDDPDVMNSTIKSIRAISANQAMAIKAQEYQTKASIDQARSDYRKQAAAGQPLDVVKLANSGLDVDTQNRIVQDYHSFANGDAEVGNGRAGTDTMRRITSTGPDRIMSPLELTKLRNSGDLTEQGYKTASDLYEKVRTPQGATEAKLQSSGYDDLKARLVKDTTDMSDLKGHERYSQAENMIPGMIEQGLAKGLTYADMFTRLTPDGKPNPEYVVDKAVKAVQPPPAQRTAEIINAPIVRAAAPTVDLTKYDLAKKSGATQAVNDITDLYRSGKLSKSDADAKYKELHDKIYGPQPNAPLGQ